MLDSSTARVHDEVTEAAPASIGSDASGNPVSQQMCELVSELAGALDMSGGETQALSVVQGVLGKYIGSKHLLTAEQRRSQGDTYTRHLIHADPAGRFSLLSIVWMPGQASPVHGHNAWGVVGVHAGRVENTCFNVTQVETDESKRFTYSALESQQAYVGCMVTACAGDHGAHRLGNPFDEPACTIHIYGMDLALEPTGINRYYD